jgi:hypothetical protein
MTNSEVVAAVAILRGQTVSAIRKKVETLIQIGLADLYSLVPGFWTKINESFTLGASGTDAYLVNLKTQFPDFWQLRMLWTTSGPINYISEKKFRNQVPDPSSAAAGIPDRYFFREKSLVELYPRNSESRTIYISYRYKPELENIEVVPVEWRFVPFYYVMGLMEGQDNTYFKVKYEKGLVRMQNFAKESEEEHAEIISDGQDEIIYSTMERVGR